MDVPDQLLDILPRHQISSFATLPSHADRIRYAQQLLKDNKLMHRQVARHTKSNAVANTLRQHGNKFFAAKMYCQAMEFYNQSICFAYGRSEELGLCYANRSAVYFEWELFDKCLENIQMARENNFPGRKLDKLEDREVKCKPQAKNKEKQPPSASHPLNHLKVLENEKYGRHIVTDRNLKVGDIVVIEPVYQARLYKEYNYRRCANCMAENDLSLIPCPGCTSTMFCSATCLAEAFERFHKVECPIVEACAELDDNSLLALRSLLGQIHDFETVETVEVLARVCAESWSLLRLPDETANKMEKFQFFYGLQANTGQLEAEQAMRDAVSAAMIINMLREKTGMTKLSDNFLNLLFQYIQVCRLNSHNVAVLEQTNHELQVRAVGKGISLSSSLFNHSCAPNARRITLSPGRTAIVVQRPIKRGEQLFVNYGMHHLDWSKQHRQDTLKSQYKFMCDCEACSNDYPLLSDLPFNERDSDLQNVMRLHSVEESITQLSDYKKYLQKNAHTYPSRVYALMQAAMHRALLAGCGNVSINTRR